jgi:hypothetical protein
MIEQGLIARMTGRDASVVAQNGEKVTGIEAAPNGYRSLLRRGRVFPRM